MRNRAFTLIELVIVTSLIGVFIGLFSSNFYLGKEQKGLLSAQNHLRSFVDYTRHQSLSALIPEACTTNNFVGYGLRFDLNRNQIVKFSHCLTGISPAVDTDTDLESLKFSEYEHVTLYSVAPSLNSIYFERSTGEVANHATNAKTEVTLTLKNTVLGKCSQIVINKFGLINEDKDVNCPP